MMSLVDHCRTASIEEILALPDVAERVELWASHRDDFVAQLKRCGTVHGRCVVLDLTDEEVIHPGSRFMIYAVYPDCDISIHKLWGVPPPEHRLRDRQVDLRSIAATARTSAS